LPSKLLERDPNKRLGYRADGSALANLKAQPWFAGLNWEVVGNKAAVPPFEPDASRLRHIETPHDRLLTLLCVRPILVEESEL
jgi:hypothetical protein